MHVPVLDLADALGPAGAGPQVGRALEQSGFLILEGHGLEPGLWERARQASREFFALPLAVKRRYCVPGGAGQRGYTPFAVEVAKGETLPDQKEFFQVGREDGDPDGWGGANCWPTEVPDLRPAFEELYARLDALALGLLRGVARYLELAEDWFDGRTRRGDTILRALHYPPVRAAGGVRSAAHGDINLITLLLPAEEPGLEVQGRDGHWWPVEVGGHRLVCNVGDMLERLTAGRLPSTRHRVVHPPEPWCQESRQSLPFFFHADPDLLLAPVPSCAGRTPIGPALTAREFLAERLAEIGLLGADEEARDGA